MRKRKTLLATFSLVALVFIIFINLKDQETVITRENFKQVNKTQIEKMGNELVDETKLQHQMMVPEIFFDQTIYDDIEQVDIEIEVVPVTELNPEITK